MEEKVLLQQGNNLQIKFTIDHPEDQKINNYTGAKHACGAVFFQLQVISTRCISSRVSSTDFNLITSVRFTKIFKDDNLNYTCKISSDDLGNLNKRVTEDDTWHQIYIDNVPNTSVLNKYTFVMSFNSNIISNASPFAALYDDTESTDFKLCGEEDSIDVHMLVLKVSSPVLEGMLSGEWKETTEGKLNIADATKETLEHFKEYIYLDKLPTTGIEQLLLLGSYFMMPDLVQKCLVKLLNKLDSDSFVDMLEFAAKFKVTNLLLTLLKFMKAGLVNIDHLAEHSLTDMCQGTNSILSVKK